MSVCLCIEFLLLWFHTITAEAPSSWNEMCMLNKYPPMIHHKAVNSGTKLKLLSWALWLAPIPLRWRQYISLLSKFYTHKQSCFLPWRVSAGLVIAAKVTVLSVFPELALDSGDASPSLELISSGWRVSVDCRDTHTPTHIEVCS